MHSLRKTGPLLALGTFFLLALTARPAAATPDLFTLSGVTFSDGATATGCFLGLFAHRTGKV